MSCFLLADGTGSESGSCANDCRMPYEVFVENPEHKTLMRLEEIPGEGTYLFNAKDPKTSQNI